MIGLWLQGREGAWVGGEEVLLQKSEASSNTRVQYTLLPAIGLKDTIVFQKTQVSGGYAPSTLVFGLRTLYRYACSIPEYARCCYDSGDDE